MISVLLLRKREREKKTKKRDTCASKLRMVDKREEENARQIVSGCLCDIYIRVCCIARQRV